MNKKYDPVIDFASFHKWRDDFNRGIQDVVDADGREQLGKNVGAVLTRSLDAIFEHANAVKNNEAYAGNSATNSAASSATSSASETETLSENAAATVTDGVWQPAINCSEQEQAYRVEVELPGVAMDAVDLEISGNLMVISGRSESTVSSVRAAGFNKIERPAGRFERSIEIPSDSDSDNVEASMLNGLLVISIAKQERSCHRVKVAIRPGS